MIMLDDFERFEENAKGYEHFIDNLFTYADKEYEAYPEMWSFMFMEADKNIICLK